MRTRPHEERWVLGHLENGISDFKERQRSIFCFSIITPCAASAKGFSAEITNGASGLDFEESYAGAMGNLSIPFGVRVSPFTFQIIGHNPILQNWG